MSSSSTRPPPRFCVLGAGNAGLATAGQLALMGFAVRLYNRSPERLQPVRQRGGVQVLAGEGADVRCGVAEIPVVTTHIAEAVEDADILIVTVLATGHGFVAQQCAPYLRPGQIVVLHPGHPGGALEFAHVLREHGIRDEVVAAETQALLYDCQVVGPAQVKIARVKGSVPLAAVPSRRTAEVLEALRPAFPQFVAGESVLQLGLDHIGAIIHPAISVLNAARIESAGGDFAFYREGIGVRTAEVLKELDGERLAVSAALGLPGLSAREWLYLAFGAAGKTLHDALRASVGHQGVRSPSSLTHRYLSEDVPAGLVPIASIGELLGVPCPTMRALIHLAGVLQGRDYWQEGRTVRRMGLEGLSAAQIRQSALYGDLPAWAREPLARANERERQVQQSLARRGGTGR